MGPLLFVLATSVVSTTYAEEDNIGDDDDRFIGRPTLDTPVPSSAPTSSSPVDFHFPASATPTSSSSTAITIPTTSFPSASPTKAATTTDAPTMTPSGMPTTDMPSAGPTETVSITPTETTVAPSMTPSALPSINEEDEEEDESQAPSSVPSKEPTAAQFQATPSPTERDVVQETNSPTTPSPTTTPPFPSASPTEAATNVDEKESAFVPSDGRVELVLQSTLALLIGQTRIRFLDTTRSFLQDQMGDLIDPSSLQVQLVGQSLQDRRRLQRGLLRRSLQPQQSQSQNAGGNKLLLDLNVTADALAPSLDVDDSSSSDWFRMQVIATFVDHEDEFVQALKDTGDAYFVFIESSKVQFGSSSDNNDDTDSPTAAPVNAPSDDDDSSNPNQEDKDDDLPLPLGVLVGIGAAAGAILLMICAFLVKRRLKTKRATAADAVSTTSSEPPPMRLPKSKSSISERSIPMQYSNKSSSYSYRGGGGDHDTHSEIVENQTLYSYGMDNRSYVPGGDVDTLAGADTMSYAYSLEAGFEASVMSDPVQHDIPTEIGKPATLPPVNITTTTRSSSNKKNHKPPRDIEPQISMANSDLELTQSELAMLPSNLRDDDETGLGELPSRIVYAPAGKLGMVVDTTVEGPVVHSINKSSALKGKVFPGDIIIAIDEEDTRAMNAEDISQLMVRTAHKRRKLVVVTGGTL